MLIPGLVSVTFRQLPIKAIIDLARRADIRTIEWGGDVHVPHGDLAQARAVREMTESAGLTVAAYGSYYRVSESEGRGLGFETVLGTAVALGAPTIRVWAGTKGSAHADNDYRQQVMEDSWRVADLAAEKGLTVSYEYHANTLTDTNASTQALLREVGHDNLRSFWQPPHHLSTEACAEGLRAILPRLSNVHVFHWRAEKDRRPLAEGKAAWQRYLEIVRASPHHHPVLLEFVRDDDPEAFLQDAATLRAWLKE